MKYRRNCISEEIFVISILHPVVSVVFWQLKSDGIVSFPFRFDLIWRYFTKCYRKQSKTYAPNCVSMTKTCKQCPNLWEETIPTIPETVIKWPFATLALWHNIHKNYITKIFHGLQRTCILPSFTLKSTLPFTFAQSNLGISWIEPHKHRKSEILAKGRCVD